MKLLATILLIVLNIHIQTRLSSTQFVWVWSGADQLDQIYLLHRNPCRNFREPALFRLFGFSFNHIGDNLCFGDIPIPLFLHKYRLPSYFVLSIPCQGTIRKRGYDSHRTLEVYTSHRWGIRFIGEGAQQLRLREQRLWSQATGFKFSAWGWKWTSVLHSRSIVHQAHTAYAE